MINDKKTVRRMQGEAGTHSSGVPVCNHSGGFVPKKMDMIYIINKIQKKGSVRLVSFHHVNPVNPV
jgi:hypothetical protein